MVNHPTGPRTDGGGELAEQHGKDPEGEPSFELDLPEESIFTEADYYEMYQAAAQPLRHKILQALREVGRLSTSEISEAVDREANDLHYHLRKLKRTALVRNHREPRSGTEKEYSYYTLTPLGEIVLDEGLETGVQKLAAQEHQIQDHYSE